MADHGGWPNFWWLNAGITGLSCLLIIFGFPETKYDRIHLINGHTTTTKQPDTIKSSADHQELGAVDSILQKNTAISNDATSGGVAAPQPVSTQSQDSYIGKGRPVLKQFLFLTTSSTSLGKILYDIWTPWRLFTYPIVIFASFVVSWSTSNILILNITQSQVFSAPPYNWPSLYVGMYMLR